MKGMLTKAFSLALLISIVPSFAMTSSKKIAEELSESAVIVIDNAAQKMADSVSPQTAAANGAISGVVGLTVTNTVPTLWERVKGCANSAAAYATTDNLKTAGKYALGLAALYAGYKALKAAYNYATTPATKKAEVASQSVAVVAKANPVVAPKEAAKPAFVSKEHEAVVKACEAVQAKVLANTTFVTDSVEMVALSNLHFMQTLVPKSKTQSYASLILSHTAGIDFARREKNEADYAKRVQAFATLIPTIQDNARIYYAKEIKAVAVKAEQAAKVPYRTRAYNALVNRYTLGGAAVAGLGYAGYKYGVPFYNRMK